MKHDLLIDYIQAFLLAGVGCGLWIVLTTEILSAFKALSFYPVLGSWLLPVLILFWVCYGSLRKQPLKISLLRLDWLQRLVIAIILAFILVTGVVGLMSAPNNWDSMTYHLSRVMHWTQNQSVAHYATYEERQLYQNPWAEFAITHLYLFTASDRLFNLVQWAAMVGCILGVGLIAKLLGADLTGQILAGLITTTIPMGLLQAVTTQNDYVVAFWLVCFVTFTLLARQNPTQWLYIWAMATSLGLAVLTKGTAYVFATPFLFWFVLNSLRKHGWQTWQTVLIIALVILSINGFHYYRNYRLFDSPLKPELGDYEYANQTLGLSALISNIPRNLGLHFTTPIPSLGQSVKQIIIHFHTLLGLDPNNPATTWTGYTFQIEPFTISENISGNFVHLCLGVISLVFIIWVSFRQKHSLVLGYTILIIFSFLLFALYLKWQPWHSRLHLPLFVLWAPLPGLMLPRLHHRPWVGLVVILLAVQAVPFLPCNPLHPVWSQQNIWNMSRPHQYFLHRPILEEPYQRAVKEVTQAKCSQLGLILPPDSWEYPFWALFKEAKATSVRIQSLEVENQSKILLDETFQPCAVVCLACSEVNLNKYTQLLGPPKLSSGPNLLFVKIP